MIVVDENFVAEERERLHAWRIAFRQIGIDVGRLGMQDDEIVPLLIQLPRPTLFTRDLGWYRRELVHHRYSVVTLEVRSTEAAQFTRRILRHPDFDAKAKRMGRVIRATHEGISFWSVVEERQSYRAWSGRG